MGKMEQLYLEMMDFFEGDAARIQHFIKVHSLASIIGKEERVSERTQQILEAASLVHDCGILPAEKKYGKETGALQEQEGPAVALELLEKVGFPKELVERVCSLVGHHHTYTNIDGLDYQILVEADFLVNFYEGNMDRERIQVIRRNVFRTATGIRILNKMYGFKEKEPLSETWASDGMEELEDFIESQGVYIRQ